MGIIEQKHLELFALELKITKFHFVNTLASTNINQSAPNFVKIYMSIRSWMSSIMGLIGPEQPELFAIELKIAIFDFVSSLSSTIFN